MTNNLVNIVQTRASEDNQGCLFTFLTHKLDTHSSLDYYTLDRQARLIAASMQQKGLKPGDRALLLYTPGLDFIAAIIGCFYAGVIAVPMYPPLTRPLIDKVEGVIRNATPSVILSHHIITKEIKKIKYLKILNNIPMAQAMISMFTNKHKDFTQSSLGSLSVIETDTLNHSLIDDYQIYKPHGSSLAFLQYTSGSTGDPKGVMVSHDNLIENLGIIKKSFGIDTSTIGFNWLPFYHDMGLIGNILQAIFSGFNLYFISPFTFLRNPVTWIKGISRYQATISGGPNFAYSMAAQRAGSLNDLDLDLSHWKVAYCGAEPIQSAVLKNFIEAFSNVGFKGTSFLPCYGMAESTLYISGGQYKNNIDMILSVDKENYNQGIIQPSEGDNSKHIVSCGKPSLDVLIVNPSTLVPCGKNAIGEIWVKGKSVTQGYWNSPQGTEYCFRAKLSGDHTDNYFLRTGDMGFLYEENLYVTGRIKDIIIIHGRKYYPQDIEQSIEASHEQIKPGKVVVFECKAKGRYGVGVVAGIAGIGLPHSELKQIVMKIHETIIQYHSLPVIRVALIAGNKVLRTTSGKVQRNATQIALESGNLDLLWDTGADVIDHGPLVTEFVEPGNPTEIKLRDILEDLLEVKGIGVNDNFLALGGDSLKAAQYIAKIREECSVLATIELVFQAPTIAELAYLITEMETIKADVKITTCRRDTLIPASYAQKRLWFLVKAHPNSHAYNIPAILRLKGELNETALEKTLMALIERHESLRTVFKYYEDNVYQIIEDTPKTILQATDFSNLNDEKQSVTLDSYLQEQISAGFDLTVGPLLRASLIKLSESDNVLSLVMHHIIIDGFSIGVMIDDFVVLYNSFLTNKSHPLEPLTIQYADYAVWQQQYLYTEVLEKQLEYWKSELTGAPELCNLPIDMPRPKRERFIGSSITLMLSLEQSQSLKSLAIRLGVTNYSVMLSIFYVLLSRYSGESDIVIGTVSAGRHYQETAKIVGFFVNTIALRMQSTNDPSIYQFIIDTHKKVVSSLMHQDLPFEKLIEQLNIPRSLSYQPLIQVMFNYMENKVNRLTELTSLNVMQIEPASQVAKFDLTLTVNDKKSGLSLCLEYNTDLFEQQTAERMLGHYVNLLDSTLKNHELKISKLELLSQNEYQQIVYDWNKTERPFPKDKTLVDLFEEQVDNTPNNIAVVFEGQQLTYAFLNKKVNQLAHYLQSIKVTPEKIVALYFNRSHHFIISILAVLKAGGAYLPIDIKTPAERIQFMLNDSGAHCVITEGNVLSPDNIDHELIQINLDKLFMENKFDNLQVKLTSRNLAYVMYTSGSTGIPKGVLIEHLGIINLAKENNYIEIKPGDRFAFFSNPAFDASTFEIWSPLLNGATLFIPTERDRTNFVDMSNFIISNELKHVLLTKSLFDQTVDSFPDMFAKLDYLFVGGEALSWLSIDKLLSSQFAPKKFINAYGPTECTAISCTYLIDKNTDKSKPIPIGKALSNVTLYIVDRNMNPTPPGVSGELLIGGEGLARGYLNRSELTAEKFIKNPFNEDKNDRLYKTGDLCRYLPDGNIEYIGRIDHQVKIRGFRIELGEIESCIQRLESITTTFVMVHEFENQDKQLTAYLVPNKQANDYNPLWLKQGNEQEDWLVHIREQLKAKLPDYMLPAQFIVLEKLPLTENGKIDKKLLPSPYELRVLKNYVAPNTELEKKLATIWKKILGLKKIGIHDNFFEHGGDSIIAIQLVSQLTQAGFNCSVAHVFEYQNISKLALYLQSSLETHVDKQTESGLLSGMFPLLPIQQWFFEKLTMEGTKNISHWNQSFLVRVQELDVNKLSTLLPLLVSHHDMLRTVFFRHKNNMHQYYKECIKLPELKSLDVSNKNEREIQDELTLWQSDFDIEVGPLWRIGYLHGYPDGSARLYFALHHLIIDTVSWRILVEDLSSLYHEMSLPDKKSSYRQWVDAIANYQKEHEAQELFWLCYLKNFPQYVNNYYEKERLQILFNKEITTQLINQAGKAYRCEIKELLLVALAYALKDSLGGITHGITLESHGREEINKAIDINHTVGWFTRSCRHEE